MQNLEQTVETSFFGQVKNYVGRVRSSAVSKIALYSLAGVLSAGLGYGCEKGDGTEKDITQTQETLQPKEQACWKNIFGESDNDRVNSIQQTADGGYIAAGFTESKGAGGRDARILKLDSNGNLEWDKTFGGSKDDEAYSIQQTKDGGYIASGYTESKGAGGRDAWVFKLDSNGNLEWDRTFGGGSFDEAYSVRQTSDGGYVMAGVTESKGKGGADAWVLKLDSNGTLEWDKTFGGIYGEEARSIQQTTDGGYIAAGFTESKGAGGRDAWILKLDSNGELKWDKTFGGDAHDTINVIQQTSDGGYIAAGVTDSKSGGEWDWDAWVFKLDPNGNLEWNKIFGESNGDGVRLIQQTTDLGYVGLGWEIFMDKIFKLDSTGNLAWEKTFDGNDYALLIKQTNDGKYIVAGGADLKGTRGLDLWVSKFDQEGNLDCK